MNLPSSNEPSIKPLFKVGQRVRARNINLAGHTRLPRYARAESARSTAIMESTSSPIRTRTALARSGSTFTQSGSRLASFGAIRLRLATLFTSICGTTTLNVRDLQACFPELQSLPRDEAGPVFAEPWQAQAFALAVRLRNRATSPGRSGPTTLAAELADAAERGEADDGSEYYIHWLAALEKLGDRQRAGRRSVAL